MKCVRLSVEYNANDAQDGELGSWLQALYDRKRNGSTVRIAAW